MGHQTDQTSDNQRQIMTDMKTGITTLEIIDDFGAVEDQQHGMVSGSVAREWWSIHQMIPKRTWKNALDRRA